MRPSVAALTAELQRLKAEGQRAAVVTPESVELLRRALARSGQTASQAPEPPAEPAAGPPPKPASRVAPAAQPEVATLPPAPQVKLPAGDKPTRWNALRAQVLADPTCQSQVRPGCQVVFGVGQLDARIMFVGEAPGADEEQQGEPFVGPAGQLLNKMITAMGLARGDVYIGNIMNWRPQLPGGSTGVQYGNRPPTPAEMAYCLPYLIAQIEVVAPDVLVALGATAAHGLLGHDAFRALGEVRGRWHAFADRPLMVTYHPSYILRNQSNRSKRMIWEDLLQVMERAKLDISDRQRSYFLDR